MKQALKTRLHTFDRIQPGNCFFAAGRSAGFMCFPVFKLRRRDKVIHNL